MHVSLRATALAWVVLVALPLTTAAVEPAPAAAAGGAGTHESGSSGGAGTESGPAVSSVDVVDGIAAQVGTEVVLFSDIDRLAAPLAAKIRAQGATDEDVAQLRAQVLERLIDRKLMLLFAKRAEITASDNEIDDAIEAVAHENQLTPETLRKSVESQGMSWDAYRKRLGEEIIQQKVLGGMVRSRVVVDEKEIRQLYQQRYGDQPTSGIEVKLQQIAVASASDKPEAHKAACDQVRAALGKVRAGADFMAVAKQVSSVNPDLGWVQEVNLASWMVGPVGRLQPAQTSDVVELPVGCAVLRLLGRRPVKPVTYAEARGKLRDELVEQKFEAEYEKFVDRLRKQTYVQLKGAYADAARTSGAGGAPPPP
jgi:peptidyl-prolyl cis-trans isomerase SurA